MAEPRGPGQLELPIAREREPDRNAHRGGRSFYFFDFDDNVAFLPTPIFLFHKISRAELAISSGDYAQAHATIGESGRYADYALNACDVTGSFRRFRDRLHGGSSQAFVEDLSAALQDPLISWKGPSWSSFFHACLNQRPLALITARGHRPETIRAGIELLVESGHLPAPPNYLGIYPVSNAETRKALGDTQRKLSVPELKKAAIRASVERALEVYGDNPFHRFGMSDDDPRNIAMIVEEMTALKKLYQPMSFFVIETQDGTFLKSEVDAHGKWATLCADGDQLTELEQLILFSGS